MLAGDGEECRWGWECGGREVVGNDLGKMYLGLEQEDTEDKNEEQNGTRMHEERNG